MGGEKSKEKKRNRVHSAEDRGVSTEADGEGAARSLRKGPGFAQHAGGEEQIPPQRVHYGLPATRADDFFRAIETATLQSHCPKRILAAHSLLHLFVVGHFEVFAQFFI